MPKKTSAGILLYRVNAGALEVFLVHPGGPFWAKKDRGAWSIPKGEFEQGDDPLQCARREYEEETGSAVSGPFVALAPVRQPSGKMIYAWAVEGNLDAASVRSNLFAMEWPPRSGIQRQFPEVDSGDWFTVPQALEKLVPGQRGLLTELQAKIGVA